MHQKDKVKENLKGPVIFTEGRYETSYEISSSILETSKKEGKTVHIDSHKIPFVDQFCREMLLGNSAKMTVTPGKNITIVSIDNEENIKNYIFDTFKV
tara:strand:+ start:1464 stop:1757 length:294 start_codon:yes stop_codon:yes gene_type:complete